MEKCYNKYLLFQNIRELSKKHNIKLGDIEKEAGVTVGYMSRLDKPSNATEPSLEFVLTAAKLLKTDVDSLININQSELSPNEQYVMNFLKKLTNDTSKDKICWELEKKDLLNTIPADNYSINPLFDSEYFKDYPGYDGFVYKMIFNSNLYGKSTTISGNCYNTHISNDCILYVMKVNNVFSADTDAIEMWLYEVTSAKRKFLTSTVDYTLSNYVNVLYQAIETNAQHPTIDSDFKSAIDAFMKK